MSKINLRHDIIIPSHIIYFLILLVPTYTTPTKKLKNCIIFSSCKCCSPIIRGCIRVYILRVARVYLFNKVHCSHVTTSLSRKYYNTAARAEKPCTSSRPRHQSRPITAGPTPLLYSLSHPCHLSFKVVLLYV